MDKYMNSSKKIYWFLPILIALIQSIVLWLILMVTHIINPQLLLSVLYQDNPEFARLFFMSVTFYTVLFMPIVVILSYLYLFLSSKIKPSKFQLALKFGYTALCILLFYIYIYNAGASHLFLGFLLAYLSLYIVCFLFCVWQYQRNTICIIKEKTN